jgi:hemoglobin
VTGRIQHNSELGARLVWSIAQGCPSLVHHPQASPAILGRSAWVGCAGNTSKSNAILAATLILALALTVTSAEATFMKKRSLYERLGGQQAIITVVDAFVANVAADKRQHGYAAPEKPPRRANLRRRRRALRIQGGCMRVAHRGPGIRDLAVDALVQDLGKTQNEFKMPAREQKELVALLAPMSKDIVEL